MNINKIILSLAVIGVVSAIAVGGTIAYFSDTETSTGNTFSAGTIDIAVDGENPWSSDESYAFSNLMPGDSEDMDVTLKNVGANPVVVWKKVSVTSVGTGLVTEPECDAEGGTWNGSDCTERIEVNDIDTQFVYSMKIEGVDNIKKDWDVRVSDINDLWIPVGRLEVDEEVTVDQNYHFDEMAGNVYQGDEMTLSVTFYAEQINVAGPGYVAGSNGVVLDNKNPANEWAPVVGDGTWGILTWDNSGNFTMKGWGLAGSSYRAVYFNGSSETDMGTGDISVSSGEVAINGTYAGLLTNSDAKYWLRDSGYNNENTLWESNLVNN